ncbi:4-hydroxythreonine-4-phosphate dehydrogenase PdxA [Sporosalibacterium faouarense]|uniref:4-hydroxythreonine-4-phosphate dehydrogenase PdxA n=1 Tax=Sporosalibacterium faouarense TaxID=516123 RepID=UPI00141D1018|nr:4-hydroxythreonine-4-phosphate dehydrogenase PdxA [Sporosalibacterium faouarense]MTI47343.1 4-hydroxythreonine-4-phosphate dehydrogenase PdxA [Bacillota bacterium]
MNKPYIGIPMGDPAGIGPEIVVKALADNEVIDICNPVVIGDKSTLEQAMKFCDIQLDINIISNPKEGSYEAGLLNLIDLDNVNIDGLKMGEIQGMAGKAAFEYIKESVDLAMKGEVAAIATTPINKEALKAGGINYIGHTEMLEDLTNSEDPLTMFQVFNLKVFFLSRHLSLRDACDMVTKERLLDYIERCVEALGRLGFKNPKLAVAGLNPHSGEHGLFGDEEVKEMEPAIKESIEKGFDIVGPVPADSVFHFGLKGSYDAVLSLYHDQGHIATKMVDFERTISITNGLPFLRTSVDHGTAFDIAGTGKASKVSMVESIKLAAEYAPKFNQ